MQRHKIFPIGNIFAGWILGRSTLHPYPSQLICHHSFFKEKRPEDGKPEGQIAAGSWTRGNKGSIEESASERRGTAILTTGSRLCRRIFYADTYNTSPRLFIFSSLTLSKLLTLTLSSSSLQGIVCKHPLFLSRSSVRHNSSKLGSTLSQSQFPDDFAQPSPLAIQKTCSSVLLSNLTTHFAFHTTHHSSISRQRFL